MKLFKEKKYNNLTNESWVNFIHKQNTIFSRQIIYWTGPSLLSKGIVHFFPSLSRQLKVWAFHEAISVPSRYVTFRTEQCSLNFCSRDFIPFCKHANAHSLNTKRWIVLRFLVECAIFSPWEQRPCNDIWEDFWKLKKVLAMQLVLIFPFVYKHSPLNNKLKSDAKFNDVQTKIIH